MPSPGIFDPKPEPPTSRRAKGILALLAGICLSGCMGTTSPTEYPTVVADVETDPVPGEGDAADDPAIWLKPDGVRILGSNKDRGLHLYGLDGRETQFLESGRFNNVDLRPLTDGDALAVATNRTGNEVVLLLLENDSGLARILPESAIATGLDEVYGLCIGAAGAKLFHLFVNDKDGRYQQWIVERSAADAFVSRLAREFALAGQPEGCVVDESEGLVYVGEEPRGIWRAALDPDLPWRPELIDSIDGPALVADVEGLTIYSSDDGRRYLLASSQGDDSYAIYCLEADVRYLASFRVSDNPEQGIDGTEETDGIDVTSADLGPRFPRGIFVAQDGTNTGGNGQNFKIVDWRRIEALIPPGSCSPSRT